MRNYFHALRQMFSGEGLTIDQQFERNCTVIIGNLVIMVTCYAALIILTVFKAVYR
jgi:hypothetical protein